MITYETPRLVVRPWTTDQADTDRFFDIYSRWEVARWLGPEPKALDDRALVEPAIRRWAALHDDVDHLGIWAVEVRETGVVAGTVLAKTLPNSDGSPATDIEIGWHLHPDSWGHGYATEAARGAVERLFAAGITDVYAVVWPDNVASQAVCRRLGMVPMGMTDRWYGVECSAFHLKKSD